MDWSSMLIGVALGWLGGSALSDFMARYLHKARGELVNTQRTYIDQLERENLSLRALSHPHSGGKDGK